MLARSRVEWFRVAPFLLMHVACISVLWVGFSWTAAGIALLSYVARVFGLTAFYHRYFSHRSFKTSRWFQFFGAVLGSAAAQRGPIWWSAHHRGHHAHSDDHGDIHSPHRDGFWRSHMLWFMTRENYQTKWNRGKDWAKFPELRFLDRFDFLVPGILAVAMFAIGAALSTFVPKLGTSGSQLLVWGFLLPTITVYHVTFAINSLAHTHGTRRFETKDESRNNFWLAVITFGEGWHNNHHHYPVSVRQGFYWWEFDLTYYILVVLSWFGLVWDLKGVPDQVLQKRLASDS